jgi:hypothetical protein
MIKRNEIRTIIKNGSRAEFILSEAEGSLSLTSGSGATPPTFAFLYDFDI